MNLRVRLLCPPLLREIGILDAWYLVPYTLDYSANDLRLDIQNYAAALNVMYIVLLSTRPRGQCTVMKHATTCMHSHMCCMQMHVLLYVYLVRK